MELWNNFRARQTRRRPRIEQKQQQYKTNREREKGAGGGGGGGEREREGKTLTMYSEQVHLYTDMAIISVNGMWRMYTEMCPLHHPLVCDAPVH